MAETAAGIEFGADFAGGELTWPQGGESAVLGQAGERVQDHSYDLALASALRRGDNAAYEELITRFEHPLHNLVYRLLHQPADAEDVTQEVFLKVFRSVGHFRGESSLKTWVYRIAVNEARNHMRRSSRRTGHEVGLDDEATEGLTWEQVIEDKHTTPYEAACSAEREVAIEAALGQVKPLFREAVVLRDVEQLSYQEIAEIIQESVATVKTRILRGRRALRDLLGKNSGDQHSGTGASHGAVRE